MNGLTIFLHSIRQVKGNLGVAVRVSGGFWLSVLGAFLVYLFIVSLTNSNFLAIILGFGLIVFLVWGISLIAVVWHRYILLEEPPFGFIPSREGLNIWSYFWYGVGISIIVLVAMFCLLLIVSLFVDSDRIWAAFDQNSLSVAPFDIGVRFAVALLSSLIYLRLALILPAVALGKSLTMGDSWRETKGYNIAILVIGLLLSLMNAAVSLGFGLAVNAVATSLALVVVFTLGMVVFQWFYFMLNISILSTLYGHIVQKREVY